MRRNSAKWSSFTLFAVTLVAIAVTVPCSQAQTQNQTPGAVRSRADETLEWWNQIGNKLIAMAKDFPEDKYDFKVQKDQRTFAQNLLHVAAHRLLPDRQGFWIQSRPRFRKGL